MEIRKRIALGSPGNGSGAESHEREFIFFTVQYNHHRDVSDSIEHAVRDREEIAECECVLALPDSYRDSGEETPLILSFHGSGGRVCRQENLIGGVSNVRDALEAGYAALDVCGSEPHGRTMGCPEHLFAAYKAYRYAVKHYNLSKTVLVAGESMGGHTAMNFANTFPNIVTAIGLIYPRLNMDGVTVDGHYCIGTWDKTGHREGMPSTRERIVDIYHFPSAQWYEPTTIGFNPYRTRSFVGADGKRIVIPPCPIKIWQGNADQTVDPVMVTEFVESVRRSGSYIEYHVLDGVGHKISPVMRQEMVLWFNRFI